jgi:hypothetical protein
MTDYKKNLEEPTMKKVQEIISKAIEEKKELKILDNVETNLENFIISDDDFCEYIHDLDELLEDATMVLSGEDLSQFGYLQPSSFTKDDLFQILTLLTPIGRYLQKNVKDGDPFGEHLEWIDNELRDTWKKIFGLKLNRSDAWLELGKNWEDRLEKIDLPKKQFLQKDTKELIIWIVLAIGCWGFIYMYIH